MRLLLLCFFLLTSCAPPAAKVAQAPGCQGSHLEGHSNIAWFVDDYAGALACAQQRQLPLVIDMWAPWCHTCLSMKTTVLTDERLAHLANKFIFVALDTDKPVNATAVAAHDLRVWPTFFVRSPTAGQPIVGRFVGAASVDEFAHFITSAATHATQSVEALIAQAEQALAAQRPADARELFATAWQRTDRHHPLRASLRKARIGLIDDPVACVAFARSELPTLTASASASDFLAIALECATHPLVADGSAFAAQAATAFEAMLAAPNSTYSIDDRSDAMMYLRTAYRMQGKDAEAHQLALAQRTLLDNAAAHAPSPLAAMTYNGPRVEVYEYLGTLAELVAPLRRSAQSLPDQYAPRHHLGYVYLKLGQLADAAQWTDAAIQLGYGRRQLRSLAQRATIAAQQGDLKGEIAARQAHVAAIRALPDLPPKVLQDAEAALQAARAKQR